MDSLDKMLEPLHRSAQPVDALSGRANLGPVHEMADMAILDQLDGTLQAAQGDK